MPLHCAIVHDNGANIVAAAKGETGVDQCTLQWPHLAVGD